MKNLLFILILCQMVDIDVIAQQENNVENEYTGISPEAIEIIDNSSFSEADTGAVILFREAKMTVDGDRLHTISYHIIGQIFDERAREDYSQIPVGFNSYYKDMKLDYARTIDVDKSFIDVSQDAIQIKTLPDYYGLNTYTDSKTLTFSLPALKPGKFFEYQVTSKAKLPVVNDYWFELFNFHLVLYSISDPYFLRIDPVKKSRFLLNVSEGEKFQAKIINAEIEEKIKIENGIETYIWEIEDLKPVQLESGMPYLYEVIPLITVSSIPDWKTFGNWVYSLISPEISVSDQINLKASELTAKANSKNEKIKMLYDFVSKEIDYIQADLDRGGLRPHSADEALRNEYGDCKDQVVLLLTLLRAVDIEAYPALINTYSYRNHQNFLPTQYFDHLIVFVPDDNADLWLDTTIDLDNFPKLYSGDQNRWALVIDSREAKFIKTPSESMEDNTGIFKLISYSKDDYLNAKIEIKSPGVFKEYISSYLNYYSKSEMDNYFKEMLESYYYQVAEVEDSRSFEATETDDSFIQVFFIRLTQPTSEYTLFEYESNIALAFLFFYVSLPFEEERQFDLIFPFKFILKGSELFQTPWSHATIKNIPQNDSVMNDYFKYKQIFKEFDDSVLVKWEFALNENLIPKDDYSLFNSDISKFEEMIQWKINFQKQLEFTDLASTFSDYFGINLDSTFKKEEFIPPRYLNVLNIKPNVKQEIVAVIETYISALNDGDEELALELLTKDNPQAKYVERYSNKISKSLGFSMKVENINLLDVMYDYAIVTYTTLLDLEKNQEIGQIRFDYLSILDKSDHHWKIYRSRVKNYVDNCTVYSTIAYAYYVNEEYDRALVIYDLARANDSTCTRAFGNIGWIYYLKGKYSKCIEFSAKAVKQDSTALYAHYNIALSYLCLGELDKAKSKYEQTIRLNKELEEDIHTGAIEDLQNLIKQNFKQAEAKSILTELFDVKQTKKSMPAKAQ